MAVDSTAGTKRPIWPVARSVRGNCILIGLPEGVQDGDHHVPAEAGHLRSLDAAGVDRWRTEALQALVPPHGHWATFMGTATWRLVGLSRVNGLGRQAWRQGMRWSKHWGGTVWATIPPTLAEVREPLLASLGYHDEMAPEFVLLGPPASEGAPLARVQSWCQTRQEWPFPERIVPTHATAVLALHDGWLFIAASPRYAEAAAGQIQQLALHWNLEMGEAPHDWAWMTRTGDGVQ